MNRWKASATHLLVSALVVGAIATWVVTVWYPPALLPMSGILGLILLIGSVDVVMGPTLTLIVFKPGKPSLKFDLAVIVVMQIAVMLYGLYVLAQNRPVFLVAAVDRINLVAAKDIAEEDLAQAPPAWRHLSWTGPVRVGARLPQDSREQMQLALEALAGRDIHVRPAHYTDFGEVWPEVRDRAARPLAELAHRLRPEERERLLRAAGGELSRWRWIPVANAALRAATLLVDAEGQPGPFVAIDPWEFRPPAGT